MENKKLLNDSIINIRVELQKKKLEKTGKNKFAGFDYFELADFLPTLNELMLKEGINDIFSIENNLATLTLIKGEEKQSYSMPFVLFETPLNQKGIKSMQDIQYLGALNTYYKRYLYLNAFGITDGDVIDAIDNSSLGKENTDSTITKEQKQKILSLVETSKINNMLEFYGVEKIDELTYAQASEIIKRKTKK